MTYPGTFTASFAVQEVLALARQDERGRVSFNHDSRKVELAFHHRVDRSSGGGMDGNAHGNN
ncbi:MAG: hypothetical protein KDF64_14720 [Geminicoccaceae bacterium]|nr:hypothetical protein [Geminicoccaceae bacterium]